MENGEEATTPDLQKASFPKLAYGFGMLDLRARRSRWLAPLAMLVGGIVSWEQAHVSYRPKAGIRHQLRACSRSVAGVASSRESKCRFEFWDDGHPRLAAFGGLLRQRITSADDESVGRQYALGRHLHLHEPSTKPSLPAARSRLSGSGQQCEQRHCQASASYEPNRCVTAHSLIAKLRKEIRSQKHDRY